MRTRRILAVVAASLLAACGGADLGAHHEATDDFPVAFDHPETWRYEESGLVSAFPAAYLGEAQDEAPGHGLGDEVRGVLFLSGTDLRERTLDGDDEVLDERAVTIDGVPATRIEAMLSDGGWRFHSLLFVIPQGDGREIALLFVANEPSFDAALFDAIAATAEVDPSGEG